MCFIKDQEYGIVEALGSWIRGGACQRVVTKSGTGGVLRGGGKEVSITDLKPRIKPSRGVVRPPPLIHFVDSRSFII